jgi:hypothetical protein
VITPQNAFVNDIRRILRTAKQQAFTAVNFAMVEAYWKIGKRIVEEEQRGEDKAEYGKHLISELSHQLSVEFGKGFTEANLGISGNFTLCSGRRKNSTHCVEN